MIALPASLALVASLLLGTPVTGAITYFQAAALVGTVAKDLPSVVKLLEFLRTQSQTPAFREWAARNGEAAIRLQPGISTER